LLTDSQKIDRIAAIMANVNRLPDGEDKLERMRRTDEYKLGRVEAIQEAGQNILSVGMEEADKATAGGDLQKSATILAFTFKASANIFSEIRETHPDESTKDKV
jgi:hypothetical protein